MSEFGQASDTNVQCDYVAINNRNGKIRKEAGF